MTVTIELLRTWCQGDRHSPFTTMARGGTAENMDETVEIPMNQPVACLVLNGVALCIVCWEMYGMELVKFFAADMEDIWQRIDTCDALESAAALTEKLA